MTPFIHDGSDSDSKSSAKDTTSSASSPNTSRDCASPEPVDLSLWAIGNTVLRELRIENETWREVHGTEGTWQDRAIAHRIRAAPVPAQQTTPTRSNDAPGVDGTNEDRPRADHDGHAALNLNEVASAWAELHGIDGTREDRLNAHRARPADEAAHALVDAPNEMVTDQGQGSGTESEQSSDFGDSRKLRWRGVR